MSALTFLLWLGLVVGAGWAAFPLANRVLSADLPDAGLAVGRILFLAIWTLLAFWLGNLGVAVALSAWLYLPLTLLGIAVGWRDRARLKRTFGQRHKTIVTTELIFLSVFAIFFLLRGFWSDANGNNNGEKAMDSALIGSLSRAQQLPPPNPYAAGARLQSYYYFGHLETALLTRASDTSVRWSYNLMCATLPALCFAALFSLGSAITGANPIIGSDKGGAWVAGAVLAGGTLQPLYQWTHPDIYSPSRFAGLDPFAISRVIPYTINEFPWFTFNQADLHGHYFDFPFQIALMTLAWSLFRAKKASTAVLAGLVLCAMIVTNTWDFPAFALLIGLSILTPLGPIAPIESASAQPTSAQPMASRPNVARLRWAWHGGLVAVALVTALLLAAPFLINLKSAANPPAGLKQPASPLREWLMLWGPIALGWWVSTAYSTFKASRIWRATLALITLGIGVAAALSQWQAPSVLVLPVIAVSAGFAGAGAFANRGAARYLCLLAACGLLALAWSETTWAGFLGNPDAPQISDFIRQDTVFKFGLQTWMLWGTASAAGLWMVVAPSSRRIKTLARIIIVPLALTMALGNLAFTLHRVRFADMMNAKRDGNAAWFRFDAWDSWAHLAPPEKQAAAWLQEHVSPGENIVEAEQNEGGDYSDYTRYTHATGISTIVGPQAHSFQWSPANAPLLRGKAGRDAKNGAEWNEVYRRKAQVRRIYSPISTDERAQLLRDYGVKYLIWGELERAQYGEGAYTDLASLPVAAQFGAPNDPHRVTIFRAD